jgi:hypothetical protein
MGEEERKEGDNGVNKQLDKVLGMTLPKMAVKQIAEILGLILDRISSLPS